MINSKPNNQVAAQEMAMPLPSTLAKEIYDAAVTDPDNFPTPSALSRAADYAINYAWQQSSPPTQSSIKSISHFCNADYPKLYNTAIYPLQVLLWPLRRAPERLAEVIKDNYFYYSPKRVPETSADPAKASLQNLKDILYYYTNELYALMRPELLRQANELITIIGKHIKPQRNSTPRSDRPTNGPAIRTPDISFEPLILLGGTVWKVTSKVYTQGGLMTYQFVDFFDTETQARQSPLAMEAYTLTPEQYLAKFASYEEASL